MTNESERMNESEHEMLIESEIEKTNVSGNESSADFEQQEKNENLIQRTLKLHEKLGHMPLKRMKELFETNVIKFKPTNFGECHVCLQAKQKRKNVPRKQKVESRKVTQPFFKVHADTMVFDEGFEGQKYLVVVTDDCTSYRWVLSFNAKDEIAKGLEELILKIKNRTVLTIAQFKCDQGSEFLTAKFRDFLGKSGIQLQLSPTYTPEKNGKSERSNGLVTEKMRCLLLNSNIPDIFWPFAAKQACFILNRTPQMKRLNTPFEMFYKRKPNVSALLLFGTKCQVKSNKNE